MFYIFATLAPIMVIYIQIIREGSFFFKESRKHFGDEKIYRTSKTRTINQYDKLKYNGAKLTRFYHTRKRVATFVVFSLFWLCVHIGLMFSIFLTEGEKAKAFHTSQSKALKVQIVSEESERILSEHIISDIVSSDQKVRIDIVKVPSEGKFVYEIQENHFFRDLSISYILAVVTWLLSALLALATLATITTVNGEKENED